MHRSTLARRATPWWLAIGVTVAVVGTACTSGSGDGKTTRLSSGEPPAGSGAVSAVTGSAPVSVDVAANVFTCPSAAEINSLTAKGFTAGAGNGAGHCEYVVTTGSTQAVRVTIDHPPASATSAQESLAQFRAALVAAGNVVLTVAPQYSADSFLARFGTLSCSVFALARDGEVMQVQASHGTPVPLDDCALAQAVTAVAGTSSHAAPAAPGSVPIASSQVAVSPTVASPSVASPTSVPPVPPSTSVAPSPTPAPTSTTKRSSAPTSPSEVLIFSTGPAANVTLPTPRKTR